MKIFRQLFCILFFSLLGEVLSAMVRPFLPIPSSVFGMLLLFACLHWKWISLDQVQDVGRWLIQNMAVFFIPAGLGTMVHFNLLAQVWWQILIILLVTVSLLIALVGRLVQRFIQIQEGGRNQ